MLPEKITAASISEAVKSCMEANSVALEDLNANLLAEKIFTDKKEYTLEFSQRHRYPLPGQRPELTAEETEYARGVLDKLLSLMYFTGYTITVKKEGYACLLCVCAGEKDGLLIGKNGQNILSLQYLLSMMLDRSLKKHVPVLIDVDSYREKRSAYLKSTAGSLAEKAISSQTEVITELMPPYERKIMHEELSSRDGLKTFSVGKGIYKKVVITPLL
jgi:spoIIIJ-associated protein